MKPEKRAQWERYEALLRYEDACLAAREDFGAFCRFMMPGADGDDPSQSAYEVQPHHQIMFDVGNAIERGTMSHVILVIPPRHGKSWTLTTMFSAWQTGLHPERDIITASYSDSFAESKFSQDFKDVVLSPRYRQVFPEFGLDPEKNAAGHRKTTARGNLFFTGRGGQTTGLGGHGVIGDDLFKNEQEARIEDARNRVWDYFTKTLMSRVHNDQAWMLLTNTRWNADDVIGRITDRGNPWWSKDFAAKWHVIHLPALADGPNDPIGREPGEALWPTKFSAEWLKTQRAADPVGFSCLYQGDPVPESGILFQPEDLLEYQRDEYEEVKGNLRVYCFSDHGLGTTKHHDPSLFVPVGVTPDGTAYFLPDVFWEREPPDAAVEAMLDMIRRHKPLRWYAENHHILKSLLPFLNKRMQEEGVYVKVEPIWPKQAKEDRAKEYASSALARCRMGKVKFPAFASWWQQAKAQIIQFPNARNDEFVDVLSLVGLTIDRILQPSARPARSTVKPGTYEYFYGDDDAPPPNMERERWLKRAI